MARLTLDPVARSLEAVLRWESRLALRKHKPRITAVTGSVGKTTTKDIIAAVLDEKYVARKSPGTYNWGIYVPLAILGLPHAGTNPVLWLANVARGFGSLSRRKRADRLVLEIAAAHPGDLERVARWLVTDAVVLTRFPAVPMHLAAFDSRERLLEEKSMLLSTLKKGGVIIVNSDDPDLMRIVERDIGERRVITYGAQRQADVRGTRAEVVYDATTRRPTGMRFEVEHGDDSVSLFVPGILGSQHLYPVLAGVAAGVADGIDPAAAARAISSHAYQPGRMRIREGIRDTVVVDDSFNASPAAAERALAALEDLEVPGRKIAILGGMLELGSAARAEHLKLGERAARSADRLLVVGRDSRWIAEGAARGSMQPACIQRCQDPGEACASAEALIEPHDVILVKGSHTSGVRAVVERLTAHPSRVPPMAARGRAWSERLDFRAGS
jgi:UDP-N-acetylmuramoyl-tripeptide--D-alanyl-D-alanine ligase